MSIPWQTVTYPDWSHPSIQSSCDIYMCVWRKTLSRSQPIQSSNSLFSLSLPIVGIVSSSPISEMCLILLDLNLSVSKQTFICDVQRIGMGVCDVQRIGIGSTFESRNPPWLLHSMGQYCCFLLSLIDEFCWWRLWSMVGTTDRFSYICCQVDVGTIGIAWLGGGAVVLLALVGFQ